MVRCEVAPCLRCFEAPDEGRGQDLLRAERYRDEEPNISAPTSRSFYFEPRISGADACRFDPEFVSDETCSYLKLFFNARTWVFPLACGGMGISVDSFSTSLFDSRVIWSGSANGIRKRPLPALTCAMVRIYSGECVSKFLGRRLIAHGCAGNLSCFVLPFSAK